MLVPQQKACLRFGAASVPVLLSTLRKDYARHSQPRQPRRWGTVQPCSLPRPAAVASACTRRPRHEGRLPCEQRHAVPPRALHAPPLLPAGGCRRPRAAQQQLDLLAPTDLPSVTRMLPPGFVCAGSVAILYAHMITVGDGT